MFQFYVKQYGLMGDGSYTGDGWQLTLRVVGVSEASPKNVWLRDYVSLAAAKTGACALFASGAYATSAITTSGTGTTSALTVTSGWTDTTPTYGTSSVPESLSLVFYPTF